MENFNLKKFLVENKLTTNSKLIKEAVEAKPFEEVKNTYIENPSKIGAQAAETINGHLVMYFKEKSDREEAAEKLKEQGIPASKITKPPSPAMLKYRYSIRVSKYKLT